MRTIFVIALAATLTLPAATATWFTQGSWEPDTTWDSSTYGPTAPTTDEGNVVYFNVFGQELGTGVNPNPELTGSRFFYPGLIQQIALLGAWQDCNQDGYVGSALGALAIYRVDLLRQEESLGGFETGCGSDRIKDGWVYEMITIGPANGETEFGTDTGVAPGVFLSSAKIWGDFNLPGDPPRLSCSLTPLPHGTTASTGGMIRYVDCIDGYAITRAANNNDNGLGIAFDNEDHGCSNSRLNVVFPVSLFGRNCDPDGRGQAGLLQLDTEKDNTDGSRDDPTAEDHAFTAVDCDGNPDPEVHNPTGSYADSANRTFDALADDCSASDSDSNLFQTRVYPFGTLDGYFETATFVRTKTDYRFYFNDGQCLGQTGLDDVEVDVSGEVSQVMGGCTPDTLGVNPLNRLVANAHESATSSATFPLRNNYGYGWQSLDVFVTPPQVVDRTTGDLYRRVVYTWYADIGDEAKAANYVRPADKVYGQEACQGANSGIHNRWNCDAAKWWKGQNPSERTRWGATVHETYQFRDVDCYDGEFVAGSGVYASPVLLTDQGPCPSVGPN